MVDEDLLYLRLLLGINAGRDEIGSLRDFARYKMLLTSCRAM